MWTQYLLLHTGILKMIIRAIQQIVLYLKVVHSKDISRKEIDFRICFTKFNNKIAYYPQEREYDGFIKHQLNKQNTNFFCCMISHNHR